MQVHEPYGAGLSLEVSVGTYVSFPIDIDRQKEKELIITKHVDVG